MKPEPSPQDDSRTVYDPDCESFYSLEVMAELAGVNTQAVLHYHELGIISPVTDALEFDTEGLRQLRRIEHLRLTHQLNDDCIVFISNLLHEIERLRLQLRH